VTDGGFDTPVFIVTRDRVTCLEALVGWLETAGYERLILVDNASTYPPLLEYLGETRHRVVRLEENVGHLAPWSTGLVREVAGGGSRYVVSDPDVVPSEECPPDAVGFLADVLDRYPLYVKAGLGLRIDDLPEHYGSADDVRRFEAQYWRRRIRGNLFHAPTDTTFAVYQPGADWPTSQPSVRSGPPYVARHLPWYVDTAHPTEEDVYYLEHARRDDLSWSTTGHPGIDLKAPSPPGPVERLRWRLWVSLKNRERPRAGP